jgi:M6 family metalloprotease-like protein
MQKLLQLVFILIISSASNLFAQRSNCVSSPYPIQLSQSNGTMLIVYSKGTEALHYKETEEGYTIIPNKNGIYEYAMLDENSNLQLSGIAAKNKISEAIAGKHDIEKHLRFSTIQEQAIIADFEAMSGEIADLNKTVEVSYPVNGKIKVLAICMQFPDLTPLYPITALSDLMNQKNYNGTGSFKDYFNVNSYGNLNVEVDVVGWYTASRNRVEYGQALDNGASNPSYMTNVRSLIAQGIDSADIKGNVDFTKYDNDSNGEVDGIIVFHAGYGAEQGFDGYIWSHRSSLSGSNVRIKDGKTIRNYCINPSKRNWSGDITMVGLGVLTHEFGHIMGLPDLYATQGSSEGIGNYGLMGGCGWLNQERTPCQFETWCKDQFGWISPIVVNNTGEITLPNTLDSSVAIRINTSRGNEYFLIENRQQKGWDRFLPSRGLAIWHINTQRTSLYPGSNTVNVDTARYGVGLKQADGQRHLERGTNRGDQGDLFPGSTNNRNFTDNSNPNSKLHYTISGVKQPSNISITNITQNADSTITFKISLGTVAAFGVSPQAGCAPLTVNLNNNSIGAESYKWYLPDGTTVENTNPKVLLSTPGSFVISLVVYNTSGNAVDSVSQTVTVNPSPNASFTVEQVGDSLFLKNTSTQSSYGQWRFSSGATSTANQLKIKVPATGFTYYYLAFSDNGCTDTAFGEATPFPTGIQEEMYLRTFSAYPNPFDKRCNIRIDALRESVYTIKAYNIVGEVVYTHSSSLSQGKQTITFGELLPEGIYFVTIQTEGEQKTLRIIKSH